MITNIIAQATSYSNKDQPHIEGLIITLENGISRKKQDILAVQNAGEDISDHEAARKLLHSLVAATNNRMHKG